ncbi:hypothetical protein CJ255_17485 [Candidatus Viridilinea mediisalina]|uniref:Sulfatase-modifying factor enzyme-like domain-containing protein n=1 Tax=Candidatus Viridilinea mediisalina TaxID=2024553 RepID=A0A2A6RFU1_9CHLR|nr:hypothetical protein CJ255_17485 [Candidatus Viridilinea mediisalina]
MPSPPDDDLARKIAELEAMLALPNLPDVARRPLEEELTRLRTGLPEQPTRSHDQQVGGHASVGVAVAGDVRGDLQTGGLRNEGLIQCFFAAAGVTHPSDEQRELVAAYLARVIQRCDRMRLAGAVRRERGDAGVATLTLSHVYVTLAATRWLLVREAANEEAFAAELAAGDPDHVLPEAARRVVVSPHAGELVETRTRSGTPPARLERPLLLTEALMQRQQCVLLGGPGSGKSSFLRHLAVTVAHAAPAELPASWRVGAMLPLYVSLGAFAAWAQQQPTPALDGPGLWRFLLTTAQEYGLDGLEHALKRAFRHGGLLLLLDGLDEVADPSLRAAVAQAIAALAEHGGRLAITCRVRSFEGAVAAPFAPWGDPVALAPFSLGQMRHFVQAWYNRSAAHVALVPEEAHERVQELTTRLADVATLRDLGQTPLLLTMITILHYYEGKLPEDRADLYEDLVQLLLTRWTQQRREAGAPQALIEALKADGSLGGFKEFHLRNRLELLAYHAHQQSPASDGRGLLDRHRVRGTFDDLFREFELGPGRAAEKAEEVLKHLEEESGLLLHEGGDRYGLPHLSYEEYLAGCHLSRQADMYMRTYGHWQADAGRWREVIFLALGRMVREAGCETAAGWVQFLLAPAHGERVRDHAERERAAFFAAECLQQMGGKAALIGARTIALPELWASLAQSLSHVVVGRNLPAAQRVEAGGYLGELGDPRPGVCTLPPPMVEFAGGSFVLGEPKGKSRFDDEVNDQPLLLRPFALARYPVTNAQYQLFIEAGGYDPTQP